MTADKYKTVTATFDGTVFVPDGHVWLPTGTVVTIPMPVGRPGDGWVSRLDWTKIPWSGPDEAVDYSRGRTAEIPGGEASGAAS